MLVNEIFESVQGEGTFLGYPALFIRLQGCNLSCRFCDTKYALGEGGMDVKLDSLVALIRNSPSYHVVFTGGEPLLQQKEISEVIREVNRGKFYEVETNGTIKPNIEFLVHLFTVSPKDDFQISPSFFEMPGVVFKFVVDKEEDLEKIENFVDLHDITRPIYLMPQATTLLEHKKKLPMLFEFVKVHQGHYRITPRLQILAYGKRKGV